MTDRAPTGSWVTGRQKNSIHDSATLSKSQQHALSLWRLSFLAFRPVLIPVAAALWSSVYQSRFLCFPTCQALFLLAFADSGQYLWPGLCVYGYLFVFPLGRWARRAACIVGQAGNFYGSAIIIFFFHPSEQKKHFPCPIRLNHPKRLGKTGAGMFGECGTEIFQSTLCDRVCCTTHISFVSVLSQ